MKRTLVHLAATVTGETVLRPGDFWPAYREVDKVDAALFWAGQPFGSETVGGTWSWYEPLGRETWYPRHGWYPQAGVQLERVNYTLPYLDPRNPGRGVIPT